LGDLGAEIIKIEKPNSGDATRSMPPLVKGQGYVFFTMNRNKKSVTLDLKAERGKRIFKELAQKGDVVVENFTPGVMERLGFTYEELRAINPKIIFASVSGFGQTGPYRSRVAFDPILQAMGGWMSITGYPNKPPVMTGSALADFVSSLHAMVAILAALLYREKTGEGQAIDISMHDCTWETAAAEYFGLYFVSGKVPLRVGNRRLYVAPHDAFRAKDGYVFIVTIPNAQWLNLLRVIGREDLADDPRFASPSKRVENEEQANALVQEWVKTRTVEQVLTELEAARVPCAPILDIAQVVDDPHLLSRNMVLEVEQPDAGRIKVPGSVFKLSETPGEVKSPAPSLGQHNEEIYRGLLGYSKEEIASLREEGII
jgi:crotonobetainyl-CoA:carnitine CoA-transferase CaiB-like acyl-CoA transferase